jgi:hypothetical protein
MYRKFSTCSVQGDSEVRLTFLGTTERRKAILNYHENIKKNKVSCVENPSMERD